MVNWKQLRKKIPAKVQVKKKVWYDVVWQKDMGEFAGEMHPQKKQIKILLGQSDRQTVICYVHELLHLFSDEYGWSLTEAQILSAEQCVYFVLKMGNLFDK